jgi:hypothetical protein
MKAMISRVSSGGTGGAPPRKNARATARSAGQAGSDGYGGVPGRGGPNDRIARRP